MRERLRSAVRSRRTARGTAVVVLLTLVALYSGASWFVASTIAHKPSECVLDRSCPADAPEELRFSHAELVSFAAEDGVRLEGWLVKASGARVIILVHGLHSCAWAAAAPDIVQAYADAGFAVFLFDLRAHGSSGGGRLGLGWLERRDVRAAVRVLLARGFRPGTIGIHGTSYGAATTLLAAAQIPEVGAVIADSAFADVREVLAGEITRLTGLPLAVSTLLMPGVKVVAWWRYSVDLGDITPEQAIAAISPRPILLIHGDNDPIIPVEAAYRLARAGGSATQLWILRGRQHTEGVRLAPGYEMPSPLRAVFLQRVIDFFRHSL